MIATLLLRVPASLCREMAIYKKVDCWNIHFLFLALKDNLPDYVKMLQTSRISQDSEIGCFFFKIIFHACLFLQFGLVPKDIQVVPVVVE